MCCCFKYLQSHFRGNRILYALNSCCIILHYDGIHVAAQSNTDGGLVPRRWIPSEGHTSSEWGYTTHRVDQSRWGRGTSTWWQAPSSLSPSPCSRWCPASTSRPHSPSLILRLSIAESLFLDNKILSYRDCISSDGWSPSPLISSRSLWSAWIDLQRGPPESWSFPHRAVCSSTELWAREESIPRSIWYLTGTEKCDHSECLFSPSGCRIACPERQNHSSTWRCLACRSAASDSTPLHPLSSMSTKQ